MTFSKVDVLGQTVQIACKPGVVSIQNDDALTRILKEQAGAEAVAKAAKTLYEKQFGQKLDIATGSLHTEILGHVYPDRIMKVLDQLKLPAFADKGIEKVLERTAVIDCGESGKDSNRFIWDLLHKHAYDMIKKL